MNEGTRNGVLAMGLLFAGASIGYGIARAGAELAEAVRTSRSSERYVRVKGLAQRDVPADLAVWPVSFTVQGQELSELQDEVEKTQARVKEFLLAQGFAEENLSTSAPSVNDQHEQYRHASQLPEYRYMARATVTVRTDSVTKLKATVVRSGELVRRGIHLAAGGYQGGEQFFFTGISAIKPDMIAEATRNARRAAEQFAQDSGSKVGGIRSAKQGAVSIESRDKFTPEIKQVRVVTTVEYFLLD